MKVFIADCMMERAIMVLVVVGTVSDGTFSSGVIAISVDLSFLLKLF
jgi:hypothetical protein